MILESNEVAEVFFDEAVNSVREKDENIIEAGDSRITPSIREVLDEHWLDRIRYLKYVSIQISTANANEKLYVWGYIPVCGSSQPVALRKRGQSNTLHNC